MITIKTKIIIAYTLVFGMMFCLFAYYVYLDTRKAEIAKIDARLVVAGAKISSEVSEEDNDTLSAGMVSRLLGAVSTDDPGLRAVILTPDGSVLGSNDINDTIPYNSVTTTGVGQWFTVIRMNRNHYRLLSTPVEINDKKGYTLLLALSMAEMQEYLERMRYQFYFGIPFALIITAIAALIITRYAFRPVARMISTAQQITARSLNQRLTLPKAHDEIRALGETLNDMIGRLESSFQSQKQFIADASHEIRTPLTVLCSELEYAEKQLNTAETKESLRIALKEIDRLTRLTDDLLLLARLDASQMPLNKQLIRVDELLLECIQLVQTGAKKKQMEFKVQITELAEIHADREKLKSVILNLLDNALKYSTPGATITCEIRMVSGRPSKMLLSVSDHGCGIPEASIPNIFKRFTRIESARSETAGSGLGLAIVEQLVHLHEGSITVMSRPGSGSTFTIELPV